MNTNPHCGRIFRISIWIVALMYVCSITESTYSVVRSLKENLQMTSRVVVQNIVLFLVYIFLRTAPGISILNISNEKLRHD